MHCVHNYAPQLVYTDCSTKSIEPRIVLELKLSNIVLERLDGTHNFYMYVTENCNLISIEMSK